MMERIEEFSKELNITRPEIVIEPGRSIVGEAGITLYTIGTIKDIKGIRKYVSVDGGMTDNIRPALYQAKYEGIIANKAEEPKLDLVTISGKCCESGDVLIKDIKIAKPERGDIFVTFQREHMVTQWRVTIIKILFWQQSLLRMANQKS